MYTYIYPYLYIHTHIRTHTHSQARMKEFIRQLDTGHLQNRAARKLTNDAGEEVVRCRCMGSFGRHMMLVPLKATLERLAILIAQVCSCGRTHTYLYTYTRTGAHIHTYIRIHVYMYTHTHTLTHTYNTQAPCKS